MARQRQADSDRRQRQRRDPEYRRFTKSRKNGTIRIGRPIKTRQDDPSNFFEKKLFTAYMESATMQANDSERDNKNVKQNFCSCIFLLLLYFL